MTKINLSEIEKNSFSKNFACIKKEERDALCKAVRAAKKYSEMDYYPEYQFKVYELEEALSAFDWIEVEGQEDE